MNLSIRDLQNKVTTLNPNAAEFVPSAFRSRFGNNKSADPTRLEVPEPSRKVALDNSESDDEAHQYWRHQLPDDITPDFKVKGGEELQKPEHLSLAGLLINDGIEATSSPSRHFLGSGEDALMAMVSNNRDRQFNGHHGFTNGRDKHPYNVDSKAGFSNAILSENAGLENIAISPLEILASRFPGFAPENLADVYYLNGCDLNSTIDMLSKLERRDAFHRNISSKAMTLTNLSIPDFPTFPVPEVHKGEDLQQALSPYRSPPSLSRGTFDFSPTVQKLASHDSAHWKHERNGSLDGIVGSSRSPQPLTSPYNGNRKLFLRDKLQSFGGPSIPDWLENGEVLEPREEAHDFARPQDLFLEQARQAYLVGNKPLAKDLSGKVNLLGIQMRAAHGKARETIYQQSTPVPSDLQSYIRGQNPLIDLHGLHVTEAIHVLKHELSILRSTARSAGQRLQVMICVGAVGHHARSGRAPARLPLVVEQYLLEEGLPYTQPQPGLLRVVIY